MEMQIKREGVSISVSLDANLSKQIMIMVDNRGLVMNVTQVSILHGLITQAAFLNWLDAAKAIEEVSDDHNEPEED